MFGLAFNKKRPGTWGVPTDVETQTDVSMVFFQFLNAHRGGVGYGNRMRW